MPALGSSDSIARMEDTDGGTRGWNRDGDGDGVWKGDLYGRGSAECESQHPIEALNS